jgi:hypothetical protein
MSFCVLDNVPEFNAGTESSQQHVQQLAGHSVQLFRRVYRAGYDLEGCFWATTAEQQQQQ